MERITVGSWDRLSYRLWDQRPDKPLRATVEVCAQQYVPGSGVLQVNFVTLEGAPVLRFDDRTPPCQTVHVTDAVGVVLTNSGTGSWAVQFYIVD